MQQRLGAVQARRWVVSESGARLRRLVLPEIVALALLMHCGGQSNGDRAGEGRYDGSRSDGARADGAQVAGALDAGQSNQDVPAESSPSCNPYACDCGWGTAGFGPPAHCVGSQWCNADTDCPQAAGIQHRPRVPGPRRCHHRWREGDVRASLPRGRSLPQRHALLGDALCFCNVRA
jgi:hypothetical protein